MRIEEIGLSWYYSEKNAAYEDLLLIAGESFSGSELSQRKHINMNRFCVL